MEEIRGKLKGFIKNAEKILILGVGNPMRGDDIAGILLARKMKQSDKVTVIEAGIAPENYLSQIRKHRPTHIIIVDSIDAGYPPGTIIYIENPLEIQYKTISTHKFPLTMLSRYLTESIGSKVILIGVQPKNLQLNSNVSAEVLSAINQLSKEINEIIESQINTC